MENIEKKINNIKTIDKRRTYLKEKLNLLSYKEKMLIINNLIDNSSKKYKKLLSLKKQYENYFKNEFKYDREIIFLKESIYLYEEIKRKIKFEQNIKVSVEEIKKIDNLTGNNTLVYFNKLIDEEDVEKRIKILYKLREKYKRINIDYKDLFKNYEKQIKRICRYISENIKKEYTLEKKSKTRNSKSYYYPKLYVNNEIIKEIDQITNINTLTLFKKLDKEENAEKRLEILYLLKEHYIKIIQNNNLKDKYKYIKDINEYINKAIRIEHKKRKITNKKYEEVTEENLNELEKEIVKKIKNNSNLDKYNLVDILKAYKYFITVNIKNYPISTLKVSKYISNKIIEEEIKDDDVIVMIYSIKDLIKNRLLILDKEDSDNLLERSILKEIRIVFDFISKNYKEDLNSTKHDYRYDIIKYFLEEEEGYPYIKKIINDIPEMVNIRIKENNDEHIIINILKEYMYNLKKLLKNKNSNYINPDYLKQVYILFSHNVHLRLTKEDRDKIDELIDEFLEYININIYKEDRRNSAKREIYKLKTDYFYFEKEPKLRKIKENQLLWQIDFLKTNRETSLNKENRIEIKENTITINDIQAYSIIEKENKKILKIHMIDASGVVASRTTVDSKIYNDMINNEVIDYNIRRNLLLEQGKYNPTITYEFTIEKNNVIDFKIYKSKIKLNQKCFDDDLLFSKSETLNELVNLVKKILILRNKEVEHVGLYTIDKVMEMLLNEEFIKYIEKEKIPFMYSGCEYINNYIKHMNNLNNTFNRLKEEDFKKLYKIINDNVGELNYSIYPFDVYEEYNLNLINNMNYLVIFNQRLITDVILNKGQIKDASKYLKEYKELEHELNLSIGHIKPEDMKFKNKRKRNKLKEYNL